ncbi:MAG: precorrin-2/cobalt-factor-2 C20-methyltransferase CobI [Phormidesmis priestleyi Ana]|uniref:Precorrin-2/cobalt-factor-2 C20-methyltransferase CobI n=1 Tax=Phormidesmis priestleyi Ana TaxID=1666911 RepID=A0A0N8KN95_9CYAN|nr:MAG: precorrin-2/cobalt-factor-2 C20-methyltransferase CobI [Phormidesmis priestleyi Ana]
MSSFSHLPAATASPLGTLYGIGVGPGDPELITVKALKRLQAAPVVAFPAGLKGKVGVAERIVTPWLSAEQIKLPLVFPYVLDEQTLLAAWHCTAEMVWPYLQRGDVVFACEGDVSFYGTFTYLAQCLQQQHPEAKVVAIAGVASPMAAAAALGIPLTCQAERMAVLPALYCAGLELEAALNWAEVVVLMKVGSVYPQVWKILERRQLLGQSYVIENATRPEQKIYTDLRQHPDLQLPYFSLLIVQCKARTII